MLSRGGGWDGKGLAKRGMIVSQMDFQLAARPVARLSAAKLQLDFGGFFKYKLFPWGNCALASKMYPLDDKYPL